MPSIFCFNELSIPSATVEEATFFMNDIFKGVANLTNGGRPELYSNNNLNDLILSENYSFKDYKNSLVESRDMDMISFVFDIQDMSPLLNNIDDADFMELCDTKIRLYKIPLSDENADLFKFAYIHQALLLSFPTNKMWKNNFIPVTFIKSDNSTSSDVIQNLFNSNIDNFLKKGKIVYKKITDDKSKFKKTTKFYHGEQIYQELATGYYIYYDNAHKGNKEHYEVFNKEHIHLGEANMEGVLDTAKRDKSKRLILN